MSLGYPSGGAPRTPGIHLSKIIKALAHQKGLLDGWIVSDLGLVEVEGEGSLWWDTLDAASRLRISMGLAWEEWYLPQLDDVTDHPGELEIEGVYMTPDGESLDVIITPLGTNYLLAGHEVKLTYKSTKTVGDDLDSLKNWLWLAQMKGYAKAMGTRIFYLHVLFVCGNYKYPITPELKCWRIEFTDAEIEQNWDEMMGHVRLHRTTTQEL